MTGCGGDGYPRLEVLKRYGRVRAVLESDDSYVVRLFLPENLPSHSAEVVDPAYEVIAELRGGDLFVRGIVTDMQAAALCGLVNSFPDRFQFSYSFDEPVVSVSVRPAGSYVVDIVVEKRKQKRSS